MAINSRYIVGYKDHGGAKVRYFGTFASESLAEYFERSLPTPLEGGWKRRVLLQPFLAHEGAEISKTILAEREAYARKLKAQELARTLGIEYEIQ